MWHTYHTPATVEEAVALLSEHRSEARIIVGGTDLVLELERGTRQAQTIVDITRIPELDSIHQTDDGLIHLGPVATHNQVVGSDICLKQAFPLVSACWQVGAPQIRNRGTVAGNLITASPANDTITPLWAMGCQLTLKSSHSERTVSIEDFFQGVRRTQIQEDEMLVDIAFRPLSGRQRGTFLKLGLRQAQAISVVNVAVVLSFDRDLDGGLPVGSVQDARITMGSVAPTIVRAHAAEQSLIGRTLNQAVIDEAARLAPESASPIDDVRGSAAYRKHMLSVFVRRALQQIQAGTEQSTIPSQPVMLWGQTNGRFTSWDTSQAAQNGSNGILHSGDGRQPIDTVVNGKKHQVRGANHKTLLRMLREDIGLTGTKEGCAEGECGSCTVFMDGIAVMSCLVPAPRAHQSQIVTVEGLGSAADLHPVQQAFVDEGAVQCGYCTPGFIMSGASLLDENPSPSSDEIKQAITGNLCRCTGYYSIISAVDKAARSPKSEK